MRHTDIPCRTGGEEFAIILPEVDRVGAVQLAEKVRRAVEETSFRFEGTNIQMKVSLGVTERAVDHKEVDDLVKTADEKLYEAKRAGRNLVRS